MVRKHKAATDGLSGPGLSVERKKKKWEGRKAGERRANREVTESNKLCGAVGWRDTEQGGTAHRW